MITAFKAKAFQWSYLCIGFLLCFLMSVALLMIYMNHAFAAATPDWIEEPPRQFANEKFIVGVGQGTSYKRSDAAALGNIAQQIKVSIQSNFSARQVFEQNKLSQQLVKENRTEAAIQGLSGIRFQHRYQEEGQYYTLAVLDKTLHKSILVKEILALVARYQKHEATVGDWKALPFDKVIVNLRALDVFYHGIQEKRDQIQLLYPEYADLTVVEPQYEQLTNWVKSQLSASHQGVQTLKLGLGNIIQLNNQILYKGEVVEGLETYVLMDDNGQSTRVSTAITDKQGQSIFKFRVPKHRDASEPIRVSQSLFQSDSKLLNTQWNIEFFSIETSQFLVKSRLNLEGVNSPLSISNSLSALGLNVQSSISSQSHYILEADLAASILDPNKRIKIAPITGFVNIYQVTKSGEQTLQQSFDIARFGVRYAGLNDAQLQRNAQKALTRISKRLKAQLQHHFD